MTALYDRRVVLREAIRLQELRLGELRQRVSADICRELAPRHRQIVQQIAVTAQALAEALAAEEDLRAALRDADVAFSGHLRPMPLNGRVGRLDDRESNITRWLAEAREYQLL